ncbi:MAG: hypothetical protein ACUVWP_01935 [bacterium]
MKIFISFIFSIVFIGFASGDMAFPTEILNKTINPYTSSEKDMKYHGTPTYYWTLTG